MIFEFDSLIDWRRQHVFCLHWNRPKAFNGEVPLFIAWIINYIFLYDYLMLLSLHLLTYFRLHKKKSFTYTKDDGFNRGTLRVLVWLIAINSVLSNLIRIIALSILNCHQKLFTIKVGYKAQCWEITMQAVDILNFTIAV